MSTVHFIDTSVMTELLNIPHMNKQYEEAKKKYEQFHQNGDVFVLPVAVLVETGNHIAHISDGQKRYAIANKFVDFIKSAVGVESNWNITPQISDDVLTSILNQFPNEAAQKIGFGDVSIVEQFNEYWEKHQPIGKMRIWSFDQHLSGYEKVGGLSRRKDK